MFTFGLDVDAQQVAHYDRLPKAAWNTKNDQAWSFLQEFKGESNRVVYSVLSVTSTK